MNRLRACLTIKIYERAHIYRMGRYPLPRSRDKTHILSIDRRHHDLMARAFAVFRRLRNGDLIRASEGRWPILGIKSVFDSRDIA